MKIRGISAKSILNSREEKTICVSIKTNVGEFSAPSPSGKSKGKYEAKPYNKKIEDDIKKIKQLGEYFSEEILEKFDDLKRVEYIADRQIGANTLFALESCVLKAIAKEQKKEIWELINPDSKKFPRLVGNCIGGGKHSSVEKKPDFQEFLLIPDTDSVLQAYNGNKNAKVDAEIILKNVDKKFENKKNDENAWMTSFDDKRVLEILKDVKDNSWDSKKLYLSLGIDVASSGFYKRKKYLYKNPMLKRNKEEQFGYLSNLIKNFNLFYIEDPFDEEDFESHAKLLKKFPKSLIVGDDLTVTNPKRLKKAIEMKSINAIIVKPNQIGSLIKVKEVCEIAKKNDIKLVFSHRSGETDETILADLAFGFGADFFKCGIEGDVREGKIKRLIEIEKNLH